MNGCFGEVTSTLLSSVHGRAKLAMDIRAAGMWDEWLQSLTEASGMDGIRSASGTVVMLNTVGVPAIDTQNYAAIREALVEHKEPFEDLDATQLDWLRPEPTSRPLQAMFIPGEHAVNTPVLLSALTAAYTRASGVLVDDLVTNLRVRDGRMDGVVLGSGEALTAPAVMLTAGSRSHELLGAVPEVRDRIPGMVSGYGVSALVETEDGTVPATVIRTPNRAFACGLHVVPRMDGQVYLGATNIISVRPRSLAAISDLTFLLGCGVRQLRADLSEGGLSKIQVGNRPVPIDGFPLLGEAGVPGLWMMTGTYRDGLHQSPLLATELAARILGEANSPELEMFAPVRPPIQALSREETVDATVVHMMATGYEYAWNVPAEWPPRMERHLRRWYRSMADELDPEFTPPPELLAAMQPDIEAMLRGYYEAHRRVA